MILSLTDYQAMDDILRPVGPDLAGRTLVNLSSDARTGPAPPPLGRRTAAPGSSSAG